MWERGEKFPSGRCPMKYATDSELFADAICVPELTSTANIKLNARVLLRPT